MLSTEALLEAQKVDAFNRMSAFVVRLAGPETYQDNLFAAAVFVAAAVPIALSIRVVLASLSIACESRSSCSSY